MFRILEFASLPSTQDAMRERLENGEDIHALVIRAHEQRSGRGQRRADWQSNQGGSYQTIALKDDAGILQRGDIAQRVAIGVARAFRLESANVAVKWPNDLMMQDKKLAGILCEYLKGHLLIGIGVNVNNPVPDTASALKGWQLEQVHNCVLTGIEMMLGELDQPIKTLFTAYDWLKDKSLEVWLHDQQLQGKAQGVDERGCLQLQTEEKLVAICSTVPGRSSIKIL